VWHNLVTKTQTISEQVLGEADLTNAIKQALDKIDTLCIQGMLVAE